MSLRRFIVAGIGIGLIAPLLCSACAPVQDDAPQGTVRVIASFYPLQYLAQEIGGEQVHVTSLTPAGVEPHDVELSPATVRKLDQAQVLVYLSGFQTAVDDAVAQHQVPHTVDAHGLLEPNQDPHFWLDPSLLAQLVQPIKESLSQADPAHESAYGARAATLQDQLTSLDQEFQSTLSQCQGDTIVVTHEAFGYLTTRYGITQIGISGLDPEQEPSPARLKQVAKLAKDLQVSTIFSEELVSKKVAATLAQDLHLQTEVLDPLEGLVDPQGDYLSIMRQNLAKLSVALDCA